MKQATSQSMLCRLIDQNLDWQANLKRVSKTIASWWIKLKMAARKIEQEVNTIVASFAFFATRTILANTVFKLCIHFITHQHSDWLHTTVVSAIVITSDCFRDPTHAILCLVCCQEFGAGSGGTSENFSSYLNLTLQFGSDSSFDEAQINLKVTGSKKTSSRQESFVFSWDKNTWSLKRSFMRTQSLRSCLRPAAIPKTGNLS